MSVNKANIEKVGDNMSENELEDWLGDHALSLTRNDEIYRLAKELVELGFPVKYSPPGLQERTPDIGEGWT